MIFPLNMVIFHSYVKLPEGNRVDTNYQWDDVPINKWNMSTWLRRTDPHCTRCTSKGRNGIMGYNLPRSYEPNISSHLQLEPDLSWFVTMELGTPIIRVLKACKSMVSLPVSSYITCKSMHIMHHQPQLSTSSVFWTRFSYFFLRKTTRSFTSLVFPQPPVACCRRWPWRLRQSYVALGTWMMYTPPWHMDMYI